MNFELDQSVEKLADILSIASQLTKCDISGQEGSRKVGVQVNYRTIYNMGSIVISNGATGEEIVRRETGKIEKS